MKKIILLMVLLITCSVLVIAQTDYYYYQGEKIPLTLNESKVVISIPKDCESTREKIVANIQKLYKIDDNAFDIFIITKEDYEKLSSLDFWEEDAESLILTSCYLTELHQEVFVTPYLNVRLKKEEDKDLLTSYAEEYKLKIVKNVASLPLWYILSTTPDSEKNPLECANELYESGDFAEAVADFAADAYLYGITAIQSYSTASHKASSEIYDLQGRRYDYASRKGVYIRDGKKHLR